MPTETSEQSTQRLKELFAKAQSGDRSSLEELFAACLTPVYRYVYARTSDKRIAEDITQSVFLKVYDKLGSIRIGEVSPLAYFFTAARNSVIDYYRKKKPVSLDSVPESDLAYDEKPFAELDKQTDSSMLMSHLTQLPEEQQTVLLYRFFHELSTKEVADMLNKSEIAIRQIQCRALKQLRKLMKHTN